MSLLKKFFCKKGLLFYIILTIYKFFSCALLGMQNEDEPFIVLKWVPTFYNVVIGGSDAKRALWDPNVWYTKGQYITIFKCYSIDFFFIVYKLIILLWWGLTALLILYGIFNLIKKLVNRGFE